MSVKLPIFIEEPGTLVLYDSIIDAELCMECIDVKNGIYKAYDASGQLLKISIIKDKVVISTSHDNTCHTKEFGNILRGYLVDAGVDINMDAELQELIHAAKIFRYRNPGSKWQILKDFFKDMLRKN